MLFKDLSFQFEKNRSYAIVGSSGIGKSTLLHMLAGIDKPTDGKILLNNFDTTELALSKHIQLLQKTIGLVFQQPYLLHELTVLENVLLKQISCSSIQKTDREKAQQLLDQINLLDKANNIPSLLSGGEQQKIAILRAIFHTPQFLLADEPTGSLDETSSIDIIDLLLEYRKKYQMGLIITTHDMKIAQKMDYILKVENKTLVTIKQP